MSLYLYWEWSAISGTVLQSAVQIIVDGSSKILIQVKTLDANENWKDTEHF